MNIPLEISAQRIADMFVGAIEQNHMTRSWCNGVYWVDPLTKEQIEPPTGPWYAEGSNFEGGYCIEVQEIINEGKEPVGDNIKSHYVTPETMALGLAYMAKRHAEHFGAMMSEDDDNVTHDVFLQCIAMREVVYG